MNINSETPRIPGVIQGIAVTFPAPYAEGHVCTAAEAAALNQLLKENISNNLRKWVAETNPTPEFLQSAVDERAAEYEFGVRSGGGGRAPADPVRTEALKLARQLVVSRLKQAGRKATREQVAELVERVFAANEAALRARAEKELAARQKAISALGDIDLGL